MSEPTESPAEVMPSATPSEEEIRQWEALPRDVQLRRLRAALTHPDCSTMTPESMNDVLAAARMQAGQRP